MTASQVSFEELIEYFLNNYTTKIDPNTIRNYVIHKYHVDYPHAVDTYRVVGSAILKRMYGAQIFKVRYNRWFCV